MPFTAVPNPTQYTEFDKYNQNPNIEIGPNLVRNDDFACFLLFGSVLDFRVQSYFTLGSTMLFNLGGFTIRPAHCGSHRQCGHCLLAGLEHIQCLAGVENDLPSRERPRAQAAACEDKDRRWS